MTMSKEKREEAALSAMETGSYVVYRGETYRIDTCEIEDGEVLIRGLAENPVIHGGG